MNRTYKVIWSKARHCYVVVSELTKSQHKSSSKSELISTNIHQKRYFGKAAVAAIVAGLLTFGGVAYSSVLAADNTAGSGDGVAIGTNSNAPKKENVAIGKGATIKYSNGESKSTGDVAVGSGAVIDNYASQGGSIAIGNNVSIENMAGQQEKAFGFGQTTYTPKYDPDYWWGLVPVAQIPDDPTRVPGSIAIGQNSYARTGGLTIGIHNYQGKLGDVTINTSNEKDVNVKSKNVFETTLGTNSFNAGAFSTVMGAYSIASGNYEGGNDTSAATKNFGATITGSLNSIESATFSSPYSGIANSIVGTANRASNSNGSLIFGAGNEIQNSITDISSAPSSGGDSAQALQNNLMKAVQDSESGGATLAIGGGNKANYTQKTSIIGVNNTVVGEKSSISSYNSINGFKNTVTNASHVKVLGQGVTINKGADSNTVIGDYRAVAEDQTHNVIIGNADETAPITTEKKDTVILGHNANATIDGGVAIGAGSVAVIDKGADGYDPANGDHQTDTTGTWKSKAAAVSVGDASKNLTRQITNVAAGKEDTDAVNVAQLKSAQIHYYSMNPKSGAVTGTDSNYNNNGATGDDAIAIGPFASARGTHSLALGYSAKTTHSDVLDENHKMDDNTAVGYNSQSGYRSTALGYNSKATGRYAVALGTDAGDDGKSDNSKVISRKLNEQLNIVGGATETVDAANIGVVRKDDDTLNIRLAKDITGLNSLQATTVTSGNVTVDGQHNVITGLSNTTWDKTKDYSQSTKAATEAQLHEAMTQATADANDTHITAGDYAVGTITDKDGQSVQGVSIDVVDKTGKVGTVRITDVAKASDVGNVTDLNADIKNAEGKTTVVDAVNHVDNKVGNLDYSSTKYVKKGEDVTTSIGKLDEAIKYASEAAGKHTIVSTEDANLSVENIAKEGEAANYQISLNKDLNVDSVTAANKITTKDLEVTGSAAIGKVTINKDDKGTIGGLTNKTWDAKNITSGQAATEDQLQAATKNAVNYDGDDSKTVTLREDTTIQNVANTTIEEGSKNAVNAGTVYKETRVEKDGIFIRQANTAGQNITALDHQVAANTESIYHINNRVSDLDNRVNKVGAGAAALAALHPLDFDPNDKWDFAVGYGNYRNANSVALGAFYRPNEDTMFSLGTNFGNGENMFNAGLSFKIGQGGSGITTSKTAMAKKIESLENTVDQQDKKIAELEALVKEQGEMIRQYVGKK